MNFAADFRRMAREALSGKWLIAVVAGLAAMLLGAGSDEMSLKLNFDIPSFRANVSFAGQKIFSIGEDSAMGAWIFGGLGFVFAAVIVTAIVYFALGSFISVGYAKFNLNLTDKKQAVFENLFEYFSFWKTTFSARLLKTVYVFLWSILFIIPGVVASYSYSMTDFILAENPNLTASEAIEMSKKMMYGNRWRLFCLHFSFIGWEILVPFTLGIGALWLTPYKQAANAAFYRELSPESFVEAELVEE